jgi:hypothetical protein
MATPINLIKAISSFTPKGDSEHSGPLQFFSEMNCPNPASNILFSFTQHNPVVHSSQSISRKILAIPDLLSTSKNVDAGAVFRELRQRWLRKSN